MIWRSCDKGVKGKLQTLIFPNGIIYDPQNESFRTTKVNYTFSRVAPYQTIPPQPKKGPIIFSIINPLLAGKGGFAPPDLLQSK